MQLTWLGQSGFIYETAGVKLLFDPYLTDSCSKRRTANDHTRQTPIQVKPLDMVGAHGVFISHNHADHFDLETIKPLLENSPKTLFFAPPSCRAPEKCVKWNVAGRGRIASFDGEVEVWAIPAAHEELRSDENGAFECLSFLVLSHREATAFFAAGDTLNYPGQAEEIRSIAKSYRLTMALPINGRDEERHARNIVGNMSYSEALELACCSGARTVIPCHYGMFSGNEPKDYPNINDWKKASINLFFLAPYLRFCEDGE